MSDPYEGLVIAGRIFNVVVQWMDGEGKPHATVFSDIVSSRLAKKSGFDFKTKAPTQQQHYLEIVARDVDFLDARATAGNAGTVTLEDGIDPALAIPVRTLELPADVVDGIVREIETNMG